MTLRIEYNPAFLHFSEFHRIDGECFPDEPIDEETFQTIVANDFWAAWDSMSLLGYCYIARKPDLAWLSRIAVSKRYRRNGIATRLMQDVLAHCSRIGLPETMLYVKDDNATAIQLYDRFGFRPIESTFQYILSIPTFTAKAPSEGRENVRAVPITEIDATKLPTFPREWADIGSMHKPPDQYVLVFRDMQNGELGYCRLSPKFPGCFPFVVRQPLLHLEGVLDGLREFLQPGKNILKLTFADEALAEACARLGLRQNYKLTKMMRRIEHIAG